jgi:hypothetical protein
MLLLVPSATNRANTSAIVGRLVRLVEVASRVEDGGATGSEHAATASDAPRTASDAIRLM